MVQESLDGILVEQYTIADETINLALIIGLEKAIEINSSKFKIVPLDLALMVEDVLKYLITERRY